MKNLRSYTVSFDVTVNETVDVYIQTPKGIADEIDSWLTHMGADVNRIIIVETSSEMLAIDKEITKDSL
jgi:hypothetical protein